jgi:hypothetical protein
MELFRAREQFLRNAGPHPGPPHWERERVEAIRSVTVPIAVCMASGHSARVISGVRADEAHFPAAYSLYRPATFA